MSKVIVKFDGDVAEAEGKLEKAVKKIKDKRESSEFKDIYIRDMKTQLDAAVGSIMSRIAEEVIEVLGGESNE